MFVFAFTEGTQVNLGKALNYILNNIIGKEGDRPDVPNVILINTNESSDDDVSTPAQTLRSLGVKVHELLCMPSNFMMYFRGTVVFTDDVPAHFLPRRLV